LFGEAPPTRLLAILLPVIPEGLMEFVFVFYFNSEGFFKPPPMPLPIPLPIPPPIPLPMPELVRFWNIDLAATG